MDDDAFMEVFMKDIIERLMGKERSFYSFKEKHDFELTQSIKMSQVLHHNLFFMAK
jgi:hypothetical protein